MKDLFTKKLGTTLGIIVSVIGIVGGVWVFGVTFATNERVDKIEIQSQKNVEQLEVDVAGAIQNQQYKLDARYWQFLYDKLTNDMYELKRQMRRYPEDEILKQDYRNLLERRKSVKEKVDESMENIKVQ